VIVVDASVVLDLLLRTSDAGALEGRILTGESLHAPHLLDVEVAQVLRRYVARGEVAASRGKASLDVLSAFPIRRYSHEPLLDRSWALRANHTAYDAAYIALAEALDATLVTRDRALATSPGHTARIELA